MIVKEYNTHISKSGNIVKIDYTQHMNSYSIYVNGDFIKCLDGDNKNDIQELKQWELV